VGHIDRSWQDTEDVAPACPLAKLARQMGMGKISGERFEKAHMDSN